MTPYDPLIGKQLGDYQIVEILGRGGMARVYKGYDARLDRYAAVKVIDASLLATENEEEYRQRFQREARAIAKLSHPNIVGIYQFGDYENLYYMAMVFIEGRDLGQILKDRNITLSNDQILQIVRGIGAALDYAHANGVIHRDVKPSNIMLTQDNRAILTDFGLALSVPEGSIGNTFGSAHYIAPEQAISSADAIPQSDLYALGVVLYQMIAGKVPFDDPSAMTVAIKHLNEYPPPMSRFNPNVSSRVEAVVLRSIEKNPEDRYTTGAAFAQALEAAFGADDPSSQTPHPRKREEWGTTVQPENGTVEGTTIPLADSNTSPLDSNFGHGEVVGTRRALPEMQRSEEAFEPNSQPVLIDSNPAPPAKSSTPRWRLIAITLLVLAIVMQIVINGIPRLASESENTQSAVSALASPTQVTTLEIASPAAAVIAEVTVEATEPPTQMPPPTATQQIDTPTPVEPTQASTSEPVIMPTATPQLDGSLLLIYDNNSIVLLNQSDGTVNAGGLTFVQPARNISYDSDEWANGSEVIYTLPAGDCIQLWQLNSPLLPEPTECSSRYAWRAVGSRYWFWINSQDNAVFEVRRGDELLATCVISAGACSFTP